MEASVASHELVGRESELRELASFLDAMSGEATALLLEGEPGIGKTALWQAAVEQARDRGHRVLAARPAEAEATLAFASLADLLQSATESIGALPDPQRRALRVALLLEDAAGRPTDPRTLAAALLSLLRRLGNERPVLVAVDDVQWLDPQTAAMLAYVLRRLGADPVGFLGTARPRTSFGFDALRRLPVTPLRDESIAQIVRETVQTNVPRPAMDRLIQLAGGNPFYAGEFARALSRRQGDGDARDVPLPENLRELVRERLAAVPDQTRTALVAVAALAHPTRSLVEVVTGDAQALDPAGRADLVDLHADSVRFTHPLFASVTYDDAPARDRRELHRRLAELVSNSEERARHLALSNDRPDARVAATLDAAAEEARGRGAPQAAADLMEHAIRLTPPSEVDALVDRRLRAGGLHYVAGDVERGRDIFERLAAELPPGNARAEALAQLAEARSDDFAAMRGLYEAALAEAEDDRLRVRVLSAFTLACLNSSSLEEARGHAHEAARIAGDLDDPVVLASARATAAFCDTMAGHRASRLREDELALLEAQAGTLLNEAPIEFWAATLTYAGEFDRARPVVERAYRRALEAGNEPGQIILLHLSFLEWRAGRTEVAERHSHALDQLARHLAVPQLDAYANFVRAYVRGLRGELAAARADMTAAEEYARAAGDRVMLVGALDLLGLLDLSEENYADAATRLCAAVDVMREIDWREPGVHPTYQGAAEALIALGELERAEALIEELDELARSAGRVCALAGAARCRGLSAAARGNMEAAVRHFEQSLEIEARLPEPLESGRTLLALGTALRRARRLREAREPLSQALRVFDELGAAIWARRATAELARLGGRPARTRDLTPIERQVAELVGAGKSNAEVARTLHVSPKTVEWNLSKVYKKLRVSSRTELAAKLAKQRS